MEDKGTLREQKSSSENDSRPGDIYHPNFLYGRPAYFDVTVCNSFQPKFLAHSAYSAGFAALDGEIAKDCKYDSQVSVSGALFYPLAVESFGCWTSASLDTLKTIASKIVSTYSIPFSQAYRNLLQHCVKILQEKLHWKHKLALAMIISHHWHDHIADLHLFFL